MRKRVYIALAVLLVILAGVIAWQVLRKPEPKREPVYHGKGLRAWLNEYLTTGDSLRAEAAVRQIGANAIPTLLDMLRTKDSPSVSNWIDLWEQSIVGVPYLPPLASVSGLVQESGAVAARRGGRRFLDSRCRWPAGRARVDKHLRAECSSAC